MRERNVQTSMHQAERHLPGVLLLVVVGELSFQEREKEEPRLARSNFTVACPLCMWSGDGRGRAGSLHLL